MTNRLILVAGSGRSGTSLFSGIMKGMGCHVPQPEVEADVTNPRGFGEPQWVVDFHNGLLRQANVHASDARPEAWAKTAQVVRKRGVEHQLRQWLKGEFSHGDHVIIKDPRLLWFSVMWETVGSSIGADVGYATLLRHPLEVVKSKQTYYGENLVPTNRAAAWINTMLYIERATRDSKRTFVKYDDLLEDWVLTSAEACRALDLDIVDRVTAHQVRDINRLVDPSLRRVSGDWATLGVHREVADMCEEAWHLLEELRKSDAAEAGSLADDLDELRHRYGAFYDLAEATSQSSVLAERRQHRRPRSGGQPGGGGATPAAFSVRAKRKAKRELTRLRGRIRARLAPTVRKLRGAAGSGK
jgi:hypothetical protein